MTSDQAYKYCSESQVFIEGYDEAKKDLTGTWKLMHRNIFTKFGVLVPQRLRELGLWWNRPAKELKYVPREEFVKLEKEMKEANKKEGRPHYVPYIKFLLESGEKNDIQDITLDDINNMAERVSKLRRLFIQMKANCYSKNAQNYNRYGGAGIKIWADWLNDRDKFVMWAIKKGYAVSKKSHGIHVYRKDKSGDFTPYNCEIRLSVSDEDMADATSSNLITKVEG